MKLSDIQSINKLVTDVEVKPLRILVLCNKMPYPATDGGAIAMLNMIKGLSEQGNVVDVLAMQTEKHNFKVVDLPANLTEKISWYSVWVDTTIRVSKLVRNLFFSSMPYNAERFVSGDFNRKLIELLENKYDIIQLEGLYSALYVDTIRQYSSAVISLRAHNVEWQIWDKMVKNEPSFFKRVYKRILSNRIKKFETKALQKVDLLVPITDIDAKNLPFNVKNNLFVAQAGIESGNFVEENQPTQPKTFFYIGALDWEPNQEALLWFVENVWSDIKAQYPEWDFHIAGRNAPQSFVDKLCAYNIVYDGFVESAKKYISKYNVMLVPLLSGSGMRIKIVEAMAYSRCVVTTPIGAEGIDVENGKHLFIGETPNELKQIITSIIEKPSIADKVAKEAYCFANAKFSNESIVAELNRFYNKYLRKL